MENCFFKKTKKVDKLLEDLSRKIQVTDTRSFKENITHPADIKNTVRKY